MKNILVYGDSNTWGFVPGSLDNANLSFKRYARSQRYPGILAEELGIDFHVIEEGLNSRTTVFEDPLSEGVNGKVYLPACLNSHAPLDLVVIMLGTNDLKQCISSRPIEVAAGARQLVQTIKASNCGLGKKPEILLISPILVHDMNNAWVEMFEDGEAKSMCLARLYQQVAEYENCHFLDASKVANPSPKDGLHLDEKGHVALAQALSKQVQEIFA
ncbi:SGNH/GDSL hydrolase family protein [Francisellaceae bacterium]|nr:SGNH/GDSL hydrolase family protein [Francisellaceae bacterium]